MRSSAVLLVTLAVATAACDGTTSPEGTGRLTLQLAVPSGAAAGPGLAAADDVLTISSVQIVARKVKLERAQDSCPAAEAEAGAGAGETESEAEDPGCPVVWLEPRLLDPALDQAASAILSVDLPEGSYDALQLQIHKPTPSPRDAALLAQHPDFAGVSIRVTGTFNGADFEFTTPLTAVVKVGLEAPVEVAEEAPAAVTLAIDVARWFQDGANLLSPVQPSQQIRSRIEQNIRQSFRAFGDANQDAQPD